MLVRHELSKYSNGAGDNTWRRMMVIIRMAPTDTTTLHTENSHVDHIMTDGLSVNKLTRLCVQLSCNTPELLCLSSGSHSAFSMLHEMYT